MFMVEDEDVQKDFTPIPPSPDMEKTGFVCDTSGTTDALDSLDAPVISIHGVQPLPADPNAALAELPQELNPRRWSVSRKWVNVSIIAFQATLSPISSTLLAVGQVQIDEELTVRNTQLSAMPVAIYILGLGLGPLYLAPLSEMYGRRIVYVTNAIISFLSTIGCALVQNDTGLIILRLVAGLAGGAGPALGGGSIGDLFEREDRGGAQAIYSFGPTFGPTIGGVIGGYIAERVGWRWTMWVCAIASGISAIASVLFLCESYAPYLLARQRGQKSAPTTTGGLAHALTRPIRMLLFAPIATAMSLYVAVVYGLLYLQLVTRPLLFGPEPQYGLFTYKWHGGNTGLSYLAAAVGCIFALIVSVMGMNRSYRALCKIYDTEKPEFRLPFMQAGILIAPCGLFIYGWTAEAQTHFIFPLIGAAIFSFGALVVLTCVQTYLVDAFGKFAASALAASVLFRSFGAALFTVFGTRIYASLGYGWGSSLLAFICLGALPVPAILWIYGPQIPSDTVSSGWQVLNPSVFSTSVVGASLGLSQFYADALAIYGTSGYPFEVMLDGVTSTDPTASGLLFSQNTGRGAHNLNITASAVDASGAQFAFEYAVLTSDYNADQAPEEVELDVEDTHLVYSSNWFIILNGTAHTETVNASVSLTFNGTAIAVAGPTGTELNPGDYTIILDGLPWTFSNNTFGVEETDLFFQSGLTSDEEHTITLVNSGGRVAFNSMTVWQISMLSADGSSSNSGSGPSRASTTKVIAPVVSIIGAVILLGLILWARRQRILRRRSAILASPFGMRLVRSLGPDVSGSLRLTELRASERSDPTDVAVVHGGGTMKPREV
ncbi:hypothetical protein CERSUDRAFT_95660 [Gelatoporia subvermispora B]|uniref:Major facilitator superfamily (MFS) profile domain-containing protein n=1 Tax=Ceriporiopsis subvermispora (strain B) TaxID=914234 RepID=M2RD20_CERS8|nr:hypothetical protein CERSUDRAFT_95660 [Gelatoporia subvermispora B]